MSLPLLHSPADVIRWLLIALGQGSNPKLLVIGPWPLYVASEASTPDNTLTVYDTSPKDDGRSMVDGETLHHYGIQVRVRAVDHPTGYVKAESIHTAFDESVKGNALSIDGHVYVVYAISGTTLLTLGKEAPNSKRSLFTVNGLVALRRLS